MDRMNRIFRIGGFQRGGEIRIKIRIRIEGGGGEFFEDPADC